MKHIPRNYLLATLIVVLLPLVAATPNLKSVSYDPAIITAGDRVNITTSLHERLLAESVEDGSNLDISLRADNKLTEDYIVIEDDTDTPIYLPPGGRWNQRFQVRVRENAPTGEYDFNIVMNITKDGETYTSTSTFTMPVDREGVDVNGHLTTTEPKDIRPGDDTAKLVVAWTNTGNKPIEELTMTPSLPEGVEPSYSEDESFYVNRLETGVESEKRVSIDVDENTSPGRHTAFFTTTYEDESGNRYDEDIAIPIRIEGRPDLNVVTTETNVTSGATNQVSITIENTGSQDAETVSARTIIERSQSINAEDRSLYIGEIESGENRTVTFDITVDDNTLGSEQLRVQLRATGDSEEGDSSVYTWTETTMLSVADTSSSGLPYIGGAGALIVLGVYAYRRRGNHA